MSEIVEYSLSDSCDVKHYILMCKDVELIEFKIKGNNIVDCIMNTNITHLLPKQLLDLNVYALSDWLMARRFDTTRSNARLILKLMKLKTSSGILPVIFNKGLSLTDCYWIKEVDSSTTFNNISLYRRSEIDSIALTSLSGMLHDLPRIENPEMTNIGSFNKAWRRLDNSWWLFKSGTEYNNYAELFTYHLGKELGMCMAEYAVIDGHVCTKNFTNEKIMLEHYASLLYMFNDKEYDDYIVFSNLDQIDLAQQYCDILLLDGIVCNPDRHEFNLGILRDSCTGDILSMAPNFDNNLALSADSPNRRPSDYMIKSYMNTIGIQAHQHKYIKKLTKSLIHHIDFMVKSELNLFIDTSNQVEYLYSIVDMLSEWYNVHCSNLRI